MDRLRSAPRLARPRARRRSRVPAQGDAGQEYLGAVGGVIVESSEWKVIPPSCPLGGIIVFTYSIDMMGL